jgi:hypothetical protein
MIAPVAIYITSMMGIFGLPSNFAKSRLAEGKGGALMRTGRCETPEAVFSFSLEDVVTVLKSRASVDVVTELMGFVAAQPGDVIEMPQEKKTFLYLALALLASNKGNVLCKACGGNEYQAGELVSFPVGAGENPLKVKVGHRKSLLKRIFGRPKRMPLFGGMGYRCPEGHEVLGLVTWRT